ncbi:Protein of unknown function (DUF1759) [Popillia japonica]|uniref:CCHC-type domain-containing protein n=1 Tax=Popillia japonica TaxID=7064 RepID=A0AAW1JY12_POPJA
MIFIVREVGTRRRVKLPQLNLRHGNIKSESHIQLRKLPDSFNKNIRALKALGQPTESWDTLLIYTLSLKLDSVTKREYEESVSKIDDPKISDLTDFIAKRCQLLETIESKHKQSCEKFLSMAITDRVNEIKRRKLCMNCLRPGHIQKDCISSNCKHCGRKHNSLIHTNEREVNKVNHDHGVANDTSNSETIATKAMAGQYAQVLLATDSETIATKAMAGQYAQVLLATDSPKK